MSIRILVETLRIFGVSVEGIEPVESAVVLIIVTCAEVFHLESGIELFASIQQVCGALLSVSYARIPSEHLAVGVVGVISRNASIIPSQLAGAAVTVIQQVTVHTANILTQDIVA